MFQDDHRRGRGLHPIKRVVKRLGQGAGKALLDAAKAAAPRLILRTFAANTRAQKFYRREGFAETGRGGGADNEEGLPDIAYEWRAIREAAA